ncbi:MAG: S-methyl-5'-thioadenosine phosphorylase [Candidatus Aenigmatarchaeota archaeon]|nr:MAG: S-methyl-5'-thioadenosine phosphorylase [Candidatus Aenigmarchaeota archaeon]
MRAEIGIIGGTGIYSEGMLKNVSVTKIQTPYGNPSSKIRIGSFKGREIAFLFRHGDSHSIPPHKVNSKANVYALEKLGVERIIGIAAVGSLKEEMKPGDIVIPDQFIDMTKQRISTFYDGPKVAHISMADPFCGEMRDMVCKAIEKLNTRFHKKGTYLCIEGPRFSTRAESNLWRDMKADIIGMTLIPEVVLAREKEICYLSVTSVTDYDCWKADEAVSADDVIKTMKKNTENIKKILEILIPSVPKERACACGKALENAFI